MRKLLIALFAVAASFGAAAESVTINNEEVEMQRLIERRIGPGVTYLRLHFPSYPLNVNMVIADLNNEYVRVENVVANDGAKGVEKMVTAANRVTTDGHKAIAGQNANFWAVSSQKPDGKMFLNQTRNISIRNGGLVTECNMNKELPFGGPILVTGLMTISPDKEIIIDYCQPNVYFWFANKFSKITVNQCNKGVHPQEIGIYNRFYGSNTNFRPIAAALNSDGYYQIDPANDATEILLDLVEGEEMMGGREVKYEVKEVRTDAGHGTLGNHDLAIVARGANVGKVANLTVGRIVNLNYNFTFGAGSTQRVPEVETAIGGNLLMMRNGTPLSQCGASDYDSSTYARSLFGCSEDGKTLYMMVIDKSTDPVYGRSAGLNTWKAAQIAKHFGCSFMMQCDGGGSAQLYVSDKVINKTTESTPRAIANALMVFDQSPADAALASIDIDNPTEVIALDCNASFNPAVLLYNQYGSLQGLVNDGYELECSEGLGTVAGNCLTASATPVYGTVTVTYNGLSVTREVSVGGATGGVEDVRVVADGTIELSATTVSGGSTVAVRGTDLSGVEVFNLGGARLGVATLIAPDEALLTAPTAPGIYLVAALTPTGRRTARLLVR